MRQCFIKIQAINEEAGGVASCPAMGKEAFSAYALPVGSLVFLRLIPRQAQSGCDLIFLTRS
jgi:hypothetical protein